jgi:transcriptional regulator with XRE-family HTH domain
VSALSDYLNEVARERDITGPRPFGRAAGLSETTAARLLTASAKPTLATLETVAENLGLSLGKLRRLAEMPPDLEPFVLPASFARLRLKQRRLIIAMGTEFLDLMDDSPEDETATVTRIDTQRVTEAAWDPDSGPHTD